MPPAESRAPREAVVSLYRKQAKVYPRSVRGRFARWRWAMVALTQALFYGLPWLTWHGRQAVWFDLDAPRFYVFGLVLQPQELVFLAGLLVISALALFLFTAAAGRLWCGYACPQTVYTEIFLWIEHRTEGDRQARMKLDAAPWGARKLVRKGSKHLLWGLVAFVTGFTFVGYFIPVRDLAAQWAGARFDPWPTFWVLFYGFATYGNAGWMREQICKYMCPYARFQSTLLDADSLVIAYDATRGEPRGSRPRRADSTALGLGACIDCTLCVQVCPTGIDIRQGLQNECIGCAACIDACDDVMDKMGSPRGLVRYATARGMEQGWTRAQMLRRLWRPRVLVYAALLAASTLAFVAGLALRAPVAMDVMRDRGALARLGDGGRVENVYRVQLASRTDRPTRWRLDTEGLPGLRVEEAQTWALDAGEVRPFTVRLSLPPQAALEAGAGSHSVQLVLQADGAHDDAPLREKTTFYVPR